MSLSRIISDLPEAMGDWWRLYSWPAVFSSWGDSFFNGGVRRVKTVGTAAFGFYFLGDVLNKEFIALRQAVGLTALSVGVSLAAGLTAKLFPNYLERRAIRLSESNDAGAVGKKMAARNRYHLDTLWDRVYKYESIVKHTQAEIEAEEEELKIFADDVVSQTSPLVGVIETARRDEDTMDLLRRAGKSKKGFIISGIYALKTDAPYHEIKKITGFSVDMLSEWYIAGIFGKENRIGNQYWGNSAILRIKRDLSWLLTSEEWLSGWFQNQWYTRINRALAFGIGKGIDDLNLKYNTHYFNAQHFLWPKKETDELLAERFGIESVVDLDKTRNSVLASVFRDPVTARRIIARAFSPTVSYSTWLRLNYDAEYAAGTLDQDPVSDLKRLGIEVPHQVIDKQSQAKSDIARLEHFMKFCMNEDCGVSMEATRAALQAFYTNKRKIRAKLRHATYRDPGTIADVLKDAADHKEYYTSLLVKMRKYHTMAIIEMEEALRDIDKLMRYKSPLLDRRPIN